MTQALLRALVRRVGVVGPGLRDWEHAGEVLRGQAGWTSARTVIPEAGLLPPPERRRAGRVLRLAVGVAQQAAGEAASTLPVVFTSSGGDGDNCHELCRALAAPERVVSPTRFMNSVHNAAAGYWSLAAHSMRAATAICAHDGSFAAGLLEALTQLRESEGGVLLVAYDADYPPPLREARPVPDAFAAALLLSEAGDEAGDGLAHIEVSLTSASATALVSPAGLDDVRRSIPAARSLPLLSLLAARQPHGDCVLDYLDDLRLAVSVRSPGAPA